VQPLAAQQVAYDESDAVLEDEAFADPAHSDSQLGVAGEELSRSVTSD
jgi:hypothetical protein